MPDPMRLVGNKLQGIRECRLSSVSRVGPLVSSCGQSGAASRFETIRLDPRPRDSGLCAIDKLPWVRES